MPIISKNGNAQLLEMPSEEKIKVAIKSILVDNSLGSVEFSLGFYMTCWDFILEDLKEVVQEFINGASLSNFFTTSFIFLIPKVDAPTSCEKLCPIISLCIVAYKIMSKLIVSQLAKFLNQMIFPK